MIKYRCTFVIPEKVSTRRPWNKSEQIINTGKGVFSPTTEYNVNAGNIISSGHFLSVLCRWFDTISSTRVYLLSNLQYKLHLSRQSNCWSLRCSWSIACQCCSNYINCNQSSIDLGRQLHNETRNIKVLRLGASYILDVWQYMDLIHLQHHEWMK